MVDPARPWWKRAILWEVPFLAALAGFMLWVRMLPYKALVGSGRSYFIGTDPFYHYRETLGTVRAFPRIPRFDPWTFYPYGTGTGQFGSLFDWVCAAYIVLTQGKGASEAYVQQVLGVYPAVLGALIIVPFYFLAKRLVGTPGAVVGAITLALLPGEFVVRSLAGYSDHHVAEALTSTIGILGVYVAAMRGHAAREGIAARRGLAKPLLWGILGGVALAVNFYTWPPAILFLAILTIWLTIVILIEDGQKGDGLGYAFGGAVAFLTTAVLMLPAGLQELNITDFNSFSMMHPVACFAAAVWLLAVHFAARATRARGLSPWVVPVGVVAAAGLVVLIVVTFLAGLTHSILWGLSWVTGIGVQRTTFTIAEARPSEFFCSNDGQHTCLSNDFGAIAPISLFILLALIGWALWKRRPADILLAIWSLVIVQATRTQIRFSYYLAINMALLVAWLAGRISEWTGLEAALTGAATRSAAAAKGRKAKRAVQREASWWQPLAVATALLLVMPGNVFATATAEPAWKRADITAPDGDLVLWFQGLDWMRANTPDAGVDLGVVTPPPPPGQLYDYPNSTYGVLTWWDYGHWIETVAQRPPVANPFQQAAPFAATYFTERDPAMAEKRLDDWVQGKGPIRYVFIDDAIATGKWGAITVWAHSQNASRDQWADGAFLTKATYDVNGQPQPLYTAGPEWTESMMSRLYDRDGDNLSHYRLVWEDPSYEALATASTPDGSLRCLHDIAGGNCGLSLTYDDVANYTAGSVLSQNGVYGYDLLLESRLKLFERVPGAHLTGTAPPGSTVTVECFVAAQPDNVPARPPFDFHVQGVAGPDGKFDVVFPYSNVDPVPPSQGGTTLSAHVVGRIAVSWATTTVSVQVPDAAVLHGGTVQVPTS
jgi:dolichyl-diphosphooligosaccharide--protein glycosyltransferase